MGPPDAASGRLGPTFLLIGAGRSGTTAIIEALRRHPDAFVTTPKEPHFFALSGLPPAFTGPGDDVTVNRLSVWDLEEYRALYRGSEGALARGEGSVSTLYAAEHAVTRIREVAPEARLVAVLRDPVERAFSAFQYLRARGFEPEDSFERALDLEPERVREGWHHLWHYVGMGQYARQLRPFVAEFGRERLLLIDHADLEAGFDEVMATVHEFIGLDSLAGAGGAARVNASGTPRTPLVRAAAAALERRPALKSALRAALPASARAALRRGALRPEPVPDRARSRLHAAFEADLADLADVAGRSFSFCPRP